MMTANAALEASTGLEGARREAISILYKKDVKRAVYAVTLAGVLALDRGASWSRYDPLFVGRSYFPIEDFAAASDMGSTRP